MRTSMTYPIRFWALLLAGLLLYQFSAEAFADYCKYDKEINLEMDLSSSDSLSIFAAAGDLDVIGVAGSDQAVIKGKVCASKEAWLEESDVVTQSGEQATIKVDLPELKGGWSITGSSYIRMDLRIEVPEDLMLEIKDSSGDMFLKNVAAADIQDSSGDIEIEGAGGAVSIRDSSGDIDVESSNGDVTIESDSSGDIYANNIDGTVLVVSDSSGDIDTRHISGNVIVERDSSGDISAKDIGGDFQVLKDGSGSITSDDVAGEVTIPKKG
jgi:DUF4097 and DUF4098 domain-containing protein YvlB